MTQLFGIVVLGLAASAVGGCAMESTDDALTAYNARKAKHQRGDGVDEQSGDDGSGDSNSGASNTGNSGASTNTGNTGTGATTTTTASAGFAQTCVDEINRYRAGLGLTALKRWTEIEACSDTESASDGRTGSAHGAFGKCGEMAQNECPGWDGTPETMIKGCLKMMWDEGPGGGHYEAMASRRYTMVACGQAAGRGGTWSAQNFK